ncbi:hypothetical protein [Veillonella magna]|uniref:hypothetical protein n=1 Tax=Veillonella magna TaxID=464322 RepID=UPI0026DC56BB|nr:hypothetical protein [Veillonella magna]
MALNKGMMESVKGNAEEIRKMIAKIPDEPRKQAALRYCDDCIAATSLVIELLDNEEKTKKAKAAEKKQSVKQEAAVTAAPAKTKPAEHTPEEEATVDLFAEPMDLF